MIRKRPEKGDRPTGASSARKVKRSRKPVETEEGRAEATEQEQAPPTDDTEKAVEDGGHGAALADGSQADPEDGETQAPAKGRKAPAEPVDLDRLALRLEALLFASGQALGTRRLSKALEVTAEEVRKGLELLKSRWDGRESALELVEVSGGWRLMTRAVYHDDVAQLTAKTKLEKLSPAALETLAVVAYRQPIGRADIEAVRGVQCGPLLRVLLDRDLIRITGRSSEPGHPLLYGTSKRFLDHFGLASLKNLPDVKDLLNVS